MAECFDVNELEVYQKKLLNLAQEVIPKESKKFLKEQGEKLRKVTVSKAKNRLNKKTGNLFKGIKVGKVYIYKGNGGQAIRVYGGKPAHHLHLQEEGYMLVGRDGEEKGFVKGKFFFADSAKEFKDINYKDVNKFLDEVLKKEL